MAYTCLVCGGKMKKTGTGYEPWECMDCKTSCSMFDDGRGGART